MNTTNNAFQTNTFINLKTRIVICEDVFENPLQIRNYALQKIKHCTKKAYGNICTFGLVSTDIIKLVSKIKN